MGVVGRVLPIAEAFVLATLVAALAFTAWWMSTRVFLTALVIASLHTVFLGVPLYVLLRWKKRLTAFTAIFGCCLIGAVPMAMWSWPLANPELKRSVVDSRWGQVMVDGVPTTAGWLLYGSDVLLFGAIGLLAGVVFWFYLRIRAKPD